MPTARSSRRLRGYARSLLQLPLLAINPDGTLASWLSRRNGRHPMDLSRVARSNMRSDAAHPSTGVPRTTPARAGSELSMVRVTQTTDVTRFSNSRSDVAVDGRMALGAHKRHSKPASLASHPHRPPSPRMDSSIPAISSSSTRSRYFSVSPTSPSPWRSASRPVSERASASTGRIHQGDR